MISVETRHHWAHSVDQRKGPPEHLGECLEDAVEPIPFFLWTAPSYNRYRDEPRFRAMLDESGVIGHRNCCPVAQAASSS